MGTEKEKRSKAVVTTGLLGIALGVSLVGLKRFIKTYRLEKMMNGNLKLFKGSICHMATIDSLLRQKKSYLIKNWPKPGIKDGLKRTLIAMAGSGKSESEEIEKVRLELLSPPMAEERRHVLQQHGDEREDFFYWLRDDDRASQDVLEYLRRENEYTKSVMSDTEELQVRLYKELRGRIQEADVSAATRSGAFLYYTRTEEGEQYAVHCRKKAENPEVYSLKDSDQSEEEILLDENKEAKGHEFYMVGGFDVSPNHELLAYGVDLTGNEKFTLHVKQISTGKNVLSKPIPDTDGSFAWSTDNKTLFYITKDSLDRPYKVWRHLIGTDPSDDVLVYHETDEAFYLGIGLSRSEKYIYIHSGSAITSEVRFIRADNPEGELRTVLPRVNDVEYSVDDRGEQFFITVRDKERFNSEVLISSVDDPSNAQPLIQHREDVKIEHIELSSNFLSVFQRSHGLQQVIVHKLTTDCISSQDFNAKAGQNIEFDEPAYELHAGAQGDFDSRFLRYIYTSFTTPTTAVDFDMENNTKFVRKVAPVLGGFDASAYKSERIWATAPDNVQIPISIVYRTDLAKLDGTDPFLLDAYGSYEICNDADFRATRLSLLDRGFIFGIAHVRGGGEMGRQWYLDGKYLKKKNTFLDFLACAEYLVEKKYTSPNKLCIQGRSAGGLTMGASINESVKSKKGLHFNCAIAGVPFVDVLTTMLDETIPLTTIEWEEWGNPAEKEYYEYMKSYSPMDNIQRGAKYPNILVTGGLHDPRVGFWEPAKFVANLRKHAKRDSLILLKMEMGAGHFSMSGRFDRLKETAMEFAFLLKCQGMLNAPLTPSAKP